MREITVIGPGRLGGALAVALSRSGYLIEALVVRSRQSAKRLQTRLIPSPSVISIDKLRETPSPIIFITVQDQQIAAVVDSISAAPIYPQVIFHTSGSMSSEILEPLRGKGVAVASFHPLASITNWDEGPERFVGAYFCLEGDQKAVRIGKKIASALGGRPFVIEAKNKSLYHAAALTAAGHVTALFDIAIEFMMRSGVDRKTARKLLHPLLAGVVENLAAEDTAKALTGTYARGDEETMRRHIEALGSTATNAEFIVYVELALRSLTLAGKAGLDPAKLKRMRKELTVAKRTVEC